MFSIDISNEELGIKNIKSHQLAHVQKWFNGSAEYRYATGLEGRLPFGQLYTSFTEVEKSICDFYLGIRNIRDNKLIGIIIGKRKDRKLWITIMAIAETERNKGYGSRSIELLLNYLRDNRGITEALLAVAEKNESGRAFWKKNSFIDVKKIGNRTIFNENGQNIFIMSKKLI